MKTKVKFLSCLLPLATTLSFGALNSPFESLPAETIGAFRFDNSSESIQEYVDNTRLGQLLLSDEKVAEYKAFIQSAIESKDEGGNFLRSLGEIGLELDDLYAMMTSHFGAAVVHQEVPGHTPMPTILVWAEMEAGIAERTYNAVLEASQEEENIERIDLDLPGGPGARVKNVLDSTSFLIAQVENRFLFAIGQVMEAIPDAETAQVFEEAELEVLGQFMAAQIESGGDFLSAFFDDAGLSSARPDFECRLEVLGDVQSLLDYTPIEARRVIQMMNLESFTKLGAWSGLVEMEERSVFFLGAPAPREGLATLFENDAFDFQPPAWVPSSVVSYTSGSFDMMKLYDFGLEIAKRFAPPEQVEQQVQMVNTQLQMMLQADLSTILSAFGNRMHAVEFPVEVVAMDTGGGESLDLARASQVMVMDFSRPEILQAGMAMISGMAQAPNSGMELVDEQGFSGIRMTDPAQGKITIAHGMGKLVFAVGTEGTSSRIFSTLANLPTDEDALANNIELREFLAKKGIEPGTAFTYSHGDQMLKSLIPALKTLSSTLKMSSGDGSAELADQLIELLPSEEELEGLLGITFSRMFYDDTGVILESVNEYK